MQSQPDWGKRGVYAALGIGIPSFLLALFAYLRPADPAHPIKFDFLFHTVAIPLWLIALLLIIAVGFALGYRLLTPRLTKTLSEVRLAVKPKIVEQASQPSSADTAAEKEQLIIPTADQLELRINAATSAVTMTVDNNRLDAIQYLDVIISSAFSFDSRLNQFRTHPATGGARIELRSPVLPSESSPAFVLLHHAAGQQELQMGNDTERPMKWPGNDKVSVQKWKLNISFSARAYSNTIRPSGAVFQTTTFGLIVEWNTISNRLSVGKA